MIFDNPEPLNKVKTLLDIEIAGFNKEKLTSFCLALTYKTKNPANILPVGESSAGKTTVMYGVLNLFPVAWSMDVLKHNAARDEIIKETKKNDIHDRLLKLEQAFWGKYDGLILDGMSAQAIKRYNSDTEWFSWDNKILGITELDSAATAAPLLRILASEGGGVSMVTEKSAGKFYTQLYSTNGRPVIFATTASDAVENQFANRCVMIEMKPNNLKIVHKKIAERYSKKINLDHFEKIRKEIKDMPCIEAVHIPFAELTADSWYKHTVISNRTLQDFLRLVQGVTLLHYKNRELKKGILISTPEDYELSRQIFCGLKLKLSAPLLRTFHALRTLEEKEPMARKIRKEDKDGEIETEYSAYLMDEIVDAALKSGSQVYIDLMELMNQGLVKRVRWNTYGDAQKKPYIYYTTNFAREDDFIVPWEKLTGEKAKSYEVKL